MSKSRSYKHPILELIFKKKRNEDIPPENQMQIPYTYNDLIAAMNELNIERGRRASISNLTLDLTRKDRGIESRVPEYIRSRGYDLRKKTGKAGEGEKWNGEFVYVGIGNAIESWMKWPESIDQLTLDSSGIPDSVAQYLRDDEGALFSVIDYCNVLPRVLYNARNDRQVLRVQNPLKWQPNEIDGFYISTNPKVLHPVEAKARTTGDQINMDQLTGGVETMQRNYSGEPIQPIACRMISNGIRIAIFPLIDPGGNVLLRSSDARCLEVVFDPAIIAWIDNNGSINHNHYQLSLDD